MGAGGDAIAAGTTVLAVHPGSELFGSDRMFLESVVGLRAVGARVVVALPERGPLVPLLRASGAEVVILPMLVLRKALLRPSGWGQLFTATFRGLGAAWRLIGKVRPDAVYVSTITLPQWPLIARARGIRVVSHVHEAESSANRIVNAALYSPHLAAHRVIFNSRFSLDTAAAVLPALASRGAIAYNGVAGPVHAALPREELTDGLRVLFIGRLSPRKGPDVAVRAVAQLLESGVPARIDILGSVFPGYEWFEEQLRSEAEAAGIADRVRFLGFRDDIWPVLAENDVLVVPSTLDEPFGNTAVEGVLALRPVIASDTSGLREAAGGYSTARLVAPSDPGALASALTEVAHDWATFRGGVADAAVDASARHSLDGYRHAVAVAVLGSERMSGRAEAE